MKVFLTYFKSNGKYYTTGAYDTTDRPLFEIWGDVRRMREKGKLPGLVAGGGKEFLILIDVPSHPHNHSHLLMIEDEVVIGASAKAAASIIYEAIRTRFESKLGSGPDKDEPWWDWLAVWLPEQIQRAKM